MLSQVLTVWVLLLLPYREGLTVFCCWFVPVTLICFRLVLIFIMAANLGPMLDDNLAYDDDEGNMEGEQDFIQTWQEHMQEETEEEDLEVVDLKGSKQTSVSII